MVFRGAWRKQPVGRFHFRIYGFYFCHALSHRCLDGWSTAVKLLRQQTFNTGELEELRSEAKFLAQLRHRNIVEVRSVDFNDQE